MTKMSQGFPFSSPRMVSERHVENDIAPNRDFLRTRFLDVRRLTELLCAPLAVEDYIVQSMADVSPTKWHLAHTSWFFETFILAAGLANFRPFHPQYSYLFNSYYNAIGERVPRPNRGTLSRPTVDEVYRYRKHVDDRVMDFIHQADEQTWQKLAPIFELGLHHEQQHQELILTDIKHVFGCNPLYPVYKEQQWETLAEAPPLRWREYPEGIRHIGHEGARFAFDNEGPRHRVLVNAFQLASRPVTSGEYLAFMEEGGYERPELWLSDGWTTRCQEGWMAPLYWEKVDGQWQVFTLAGRKELNQAEPVCHVSYYEADAYARWCGARLATEAEWEVAAEGCPVEGNLLESGRFHPMGGGMLSRPDSTQTKDGKQKRPRKHGTRTDSFSPTQLYGDVWEWTQSPYVPYPGFQPAAGALGEYNGKFMCNQLVLRGGSCVTPPGHIRSTYRNFFSPAARWQFTGIRLAKDGGKP